MRFRRGSVLFTFVGLVVSCDAPVSLPGLLPGPADATAPAPRDATTPTDTGVADGGQTIADARPQDSGAVDAGVEACDLGDPGAADRPRVVLVGHRLGASPGTEGTWVRSLSMSSQGELTDHGARLDVGMKPSRIAFVPSGAFALVAGGSGQLVSVRVSGAGRLEISDTLTLPSAQIEDLHVADDGATIFAVGSNVAETAGISTVEIDCQGKLTQITSAFFNIRLAESLAFLPGRQRAVLLGGQAVFDPVDDDDLRLLQRSSSGWTQVAAFDIWMDFVSAGRIATSPDGRVLLVPNHSAFSAEGSQLLIASIEGDTITEVSRIRDLRDPAEVLYSTDGRTVLVSQGEANQVAVFEARDARLTAQAPITGVGLADDMAIIRRGPAAETVLIPSVDVTGGPNVARLSITGAGQVRDLGQVELGSGGDNIPGPIAVMP